MGWVSAFEFAPTSLEVNAQAVIQHLRFRAFDAELGTDRDALTRYGARIGLEGQIIVVDHLGPCFGAEVLAATPPYTVEVKAERLGSDEGPKWAPFSLCVSNANATCGARSTNLPAGAKL